MEATSFLYGANSEFIEQLYQRYLKSPRSVDLSWREFFEGLDDDADSVFAELRGASWSPKNGGEMPAELGEPFEEQTQLLGTTALAPAAVGAVSAQHIRQATLDSLRALMLIRAHRVRGHLKATLDPLNLNPGREHPELDPKTYGFDDAAMDRPIFINYVLGLETATLGEILDILNRTYCGTIGVEFMHMQGPEEKAWIQEHMESRYDERRYRPAERRDILAQLTQAEGFERFLQMKYTGTKRFGLDGAEALMPLMESLVTRAAELGVREVSLGMPHRGRLNVLANFMEKAYTAIFAEFQGNAARPEDVQGSGDVKYHLGTSADREFGGYMVHLSLAANPSHLEAVDPVVIGKARALNSSSCARWPVLPPSGSVSSPATNFSASASHASYFGISSG